MPYTVAGYPTGKIQTGLPWAPATDGLRNITGHVNCDGTVTIWAITSTVSGNGDQGADPNRLVTITDNWRQRACPQAKASRQFGRRVLAKSSVVFHSHREPTSQCFTTRTHDKSLGAGSVAYVDSAIQTAFAPPGPRSLCVLPIILRRQKLSQTAQLLTPARVFKLAAPIDLAGVPTESDLRL